MAVGSRHGACGGPLHDKKIEGVVGDETEEEAVSDPMFPLNFT